MAVSEENMSEKSLKAILTKKGVSYPQDATKDVLVTLLKNTRSAPTRQSATTSQVPAAPETPAPLPKEAVKENTFGLPFAGEMHTNIEALFSRGLLSAEERVTRHLQAMESAHPKPTSLQPTSIITGDYSAKKQEFLLFRKSLVGEYEQPLPSADLRRFARQFHALPARNHHHPEVLKYFQLLSTHMSHHLVHLLADEPTITPAQEHFRQDWRFFLAVLAALFYFSGDHEVGNRKIGGMIRCFSCPLSSFAEGLTELQRSEGTDWLTTIVKHHTTNSTAASTQPSKRQREQSTTRHCSNCASKGFLPASRTHDTQDCRFVKKDTKK
jgi:hypothetical protein